ncbi:hypothetical protein Tco_1083840 [Tanacetum coccineum]
MELCTNLQTRVLDLEKIKTTQQIEIDSLKRRVKKLEQKKRSRTHGLKRLHKVGMSRRVESSGDEEDLGEDASKQGRRINDIDADEDITLVNVQDDADNEIFDVDALTGNEVFAEQEVAAKGVNLIIDEVTLAQALAALKSVKPKVKRVVIEEPSVPVSAANALIKVSAATTTTATIPTPRKGIVIIELGTPTTTISSQQSQDKGKGILIEEPVKPKKKDFIRETSLDVIHLMLPIHRSEDQNLIDEASTSRAPATATTTDLSTTFVLTNSVPLVSVADHEALCAGPSTEVPSSSKIVFEKEELDTTLEHTTAPRACSVFCCYPIFAPRDSLS